LVLKNVYILSESVEELVCHLRAFLFTGGFAEAMIVTASAALNNHHASLPEIPSFARVARIGPPASAA
jgi:hypothetical protein